MMMPARATARGCCFVTLAIMLLMTGCKRENMYSQEKSQTWDRSNFFPNDSTMQRPPTGSIARNTPDQPVPQPAVADAAMLARGQDRFNIFCTPCHGRAGDAEGMIVQRGFPKPPSFHSAALRKAKASRFYDAITNGHGAMYSYADRVSPADRWAVIAYIRALQRSQDAPAAVLSAQDRARLGGSP